MNNLAIDAAPVPDRPVRPSIQFLRRAWSYRRTQVGAALVGLVITIALVGPVVAPHDPAMFVTAPYAPPSADALLGGDTVGYDVLSRFLWGGRSILLMSFASAGLGLVIGVTVGLLAAYSRPRVDDMLMRSVDVMLAFPSIILGLVAVAAVGPRPWLIVVAVAVTTAPRIARVTRGAAIEIVQRDFVRSAQALGESRTRILLGDVLPNIAGPLSVEAGIRLTYAIALIAALSFLGFGLQAPAADWGLMINENRQGLTIQPWGVILPVVAIAVLSVGTGLLGDGVARATAGVGEDAE